MAKVLVVDDDSHFRGIIERIILRSYTYSVTSVANEEEAWEELLKNTYDLVLLDLYIDGKKSWDTLKRIKALPSSPVVIMISCENLTENAEHARALGAADFVPKPIEFARFKTTVDAALAGKHKAQPVRRIRDAAGEPGGADEMRILIVGGETPDRKAIGKPLEMAGFRTSEAENARSALEIVRKEPVDAVLVCFQGDRERAAETCRTIREGAAGTHRFPMIAVTDAGPETILASLKAGADDYIAVPFDARILAGKVEAHVRLRREYDHRLEEVVALCVKDALTGSYGHAYFKARLSEEFRRSQRYKRSLALAILGLDNLEKVKAAFGATAGERILAEASRAIQGSIRSSDVLARSGEEEFALIMPEATADRVVRKAALLRTRVEERIASLDGRRTEVACAVGLASLPLPIPPPTPPGGGEPAQVPSAEDLLGMANMALTRARASQTERVSVFGK